MKILSNYVGKFALEVDLNVITSIELIGNKLFDVEENGDKTELHADTESTFFENPTTKDG